MALQFGGVRQAARPRRHPAIASLMEEDVAGFGPWDGMDSADELGNVIVGPWGDGTTLGALDLVDPDGDEFGLAFLAAIPAIAAGVSAAAAAGTGVASMVAGIVKQVRANENAEIKEARARGASPAEIRAIRRRWRKEKQKRVKAARSKARAARKRKRGKGKKGRRHVAKPKRRRLTPEERQRQAAEVAKGFQTAAVIGATSTDVLHRVGMGIQEASAGVAVDPWTGQPSVHPVVSAPPPAGAVPMGESWLTRPVLGPVPGWGIIAGGVLVLGGLALAMRR